MNNKTKQKSEWEETDKMSNEKEVLGMLRSAAEIFVPMSDCTRMPFVMCDPETYDDEVLVFLNHEDAKRECKKIAEQKNPIRIFRVEQRHLLFFYSSLMPMGVNAIAVDKGTENETIVQLSSLIKRKNGDVDDQGRPIVENPELQLTALYFMQKTRAVKDAQMTEEIKELQEEMLAHYAEGRYIVPFQENVGVAILKQKDGRVLQPLFTDIQEYLKFQNMQKDQNFKTAVVEAKKVIDVLAKESEGIVINPYSINLQLQIHKKANPEKQNVAQDETETVELTEEQLAKEAAVQSALDAYAREVEE